MVKWRNKKSLPNKRLRTLSLESTSSYRPRDQESNSGSSRTQTQSLSTQPSSRQTSTQEQSSPEIDSTWRLSESQISATPTQSLKSTDAGDVTARVSQQDSQDRDPDLAYEASLSTSSGCRTSHTASTQVSQGPDEPTFPLRVIPDSQPLSEDSNNIRARHFGNDNPILYTTEPGTRSEGNPESSPSASHILVPASQCNNIAYQRSTSAPVPNQGPEPLPLPLSLPKSKSDLTRIDALPIGHRSNTRSEIRDSADKSTSSSHTAHLHNSDLARLKSNFRVTAVEDTDLTNFTPYTQIEDSQASTRNSAQDSSRLLETVNFKSAHIGLERDSCNEGIITIESSQTLGDHRSETFLNQQSLSISSRSGHQVNPAEATGSIMSASPSVGQISN